MVCAVEAEPWGSSTNQASGAKGLGWQLDLGNKRAPRHWVGDIQEQEGERELSDHNHTITWCGQAVLSSTKCGSGSLAFQL